MKRSFIFHSCIYHFIIQINNDKQCNAVPGVHCTITIKRSYWQWQKNPPRDCKVVVFCKTHVCWRHWGYSNHNVGKHVLIMISLGIIKSSTNLVFIQTIAKHTLTQTQNSGNGSNMCMKRKTTFQVYFRFTTIRNQYLHEFFLILLHFKDNITFL